MQAFAILGNNREFEGIGYALAPHGRRRQIVTQEPVNRDFLESALCGKVHDVQAAIHENGVEFNAEEAGRTGPAPRGTAHPP